MRCCCKETADELTKNVKITMETRWSTLKSSGWMAKKQKSTNWYIKLEDKWVYSEYNRVNDPDQNKTTLFSTGVEGQRAFDSIRGSIRVMIVSSLLFICAYISPYPLAIYPAWLCFAAWYWEYAHAYKISSGYPFL